MKTWIITTIVTSGDEYDRIHILNQIDRDLNRGDGVHMKVLIGTTALEQTLIFVGEEDDD